MDVAVPHITFWHRFMAESGRSEAADRYVRTVRFGEGEAGAEAAAKLVVTGAKTASCLPLMLYEANDESLPAPGMLRIVEDDAGRPIAVIETTEVVTEKFCEIDDAFARAHAEWGGSLKGFRRQCRSVFGPRCRALGRPFSEETELVCERFEVLFTAEAADAE